MSDSSLPQKGDTWIGPHGEQFLVREVDEYNGEPHVLFKMIEKGNFRGPGVRRGGIEYLPLRAFLEWVPEKCEECSSEQT